VGVNLLFVYLEEMLGFVLRLTKEIKTEVKEGREKRE